MATRPDVLINLTVDQAWSSFYAIVFTVAVTTFREQPPFSDTVSAEKEKCTPIMRRYSLTVSHNSLSLVQTEWPCGMAVGS